MADIPAITSVSPAEHSIIEIKDSRSNWNLFWQNLSLCIENKKTGELRKVLNGSSGQANAGEVVAILGPSGAGKSSLLNALSGRVLSKFPPQGTVLLNGVSRDKNWRYISAYVQQQDVLFPNLTVRETLLFSAMLRLPSSVSGQEKHALTDKLIREFGLKEVAGSYIGTKEKPVISGGEKKRLAIAIETISNPGILFIDEPTSGLDASTSMSVMSSIKRLTKEKGRTVVLTIHQPSAKMLELFDKIILLAKGKTVFFGTVSEAIQHFEALGYKCPALENPADFFLSLITIDSQSDEAASESETRIEKLINTWDSHPVPKRQVPAFSEPFKHQSNSMSTFQQTMILFSRYLKLRIRTSRDLIVILVQIVLYSVMAARFCTAEGRTPSIIFIFYFMIGQILVPLLSYGQDYILDKDIITRERAASYYDSLSCFAAKFMSIVFPIYALFALLSCAYTFFDVKFAVNALSLPGFYLVTLLMNMTFICIGLTTAVLIDSAVIKAFLNTFIFALYYISSGIFFNLTFKLHGLFLLNFISPSYYGLNAIAHILQLESIVFVDLSLIASIGGLFAFFILHFTLAWLALKYATRPDIKLTDQQ